MPQLESSKFYAINLLANLTQRIHGLMSWEAALADIALAPQAHRAR